MDERTAKQILEDRREADRRRFAKYKERQEALGKRHISGMISAEAYDLLSRERDVTGQSVSAIVERALIGFYGVSKPVPEVEPEPQIEQIEEVESVPDRQDTEKYKDYIISLVRQLKKDGCPSFTKAIDHLNEKGILSVSGSAKLNKGTVSKWMKKRGMTWEDL